MKVYCIHNEKIVVLHELGCRVKSHRKGQMRKLTSVGLPIGVVQGAKYDLKCFHPNVQVLHIVNSFSAHM